MRIEELRVGNKILINDLIITVKSINFNPVNTWYYVGVDENSNQYILSFCKPIPLTEDILLKCGLTNETIVTDGGEIDINLESKTVTVAGSDSVTMGMVYTVKCEYLHQLQNLYFALTGEELTIKI